MVTQVRSRLGHAACVARGADTAAFAGEGDQEVVTTVVAANAGKAVGEDATFEVFAKSFLYVSGRAVVVALAVELPGTGQLKPSLEVLGDRLVEQGALGVARVVGFGLVGSGGGSDLSWPGRRCGIGAQRNMRVPTRVMAQMLR